MGGQTAELYALRTSFFEGDLVEQARRQPPLARDADERGDLHFQTSLRVGEITMIWLARDAPDEAIATVDEAMRPWPGDRYLVQHWWALQSRVLIGLYRGDGHAVADLVEGQWRALSRSLLLKVQIIRVLARSYRGAAAVVSDSLDRADAEARGILRERSGWGDGLGHLLHAAVASRRRDDERAIASLERADAAFVAADMPLFATATRHTLGGLVKGDRGRALIDQAETSLRALGVKDVARTVRTLAPGFER